MKYKDPYENKPLSYGAYALAIILFFLAVFVLESGKDKPEQPPTKTHPVGDRVVGNEDGKVEAGNLLLPTEEENPTFYRDQTLKT